MTTVLLSHDLVGALKDLRLVEKTFGEGTSDWPVAMVMLPTKPHSSLASRCIAWFRPMLDLSGLNLVVGPSIASKRDPWCDSLVALAVGVASPGRVCLLNAKHTLWVGDAAHVNDPGSLLMRHPTHDAVWETSVGRQEDPTVPSLAQFLLEDLAKCGSPRFREVSTFRRSPESSWPFGLDDDQLRKYQIQTRRVKSATIRASAFISALDAFLPQDRRMQWTTFNVANTLLQAGFILALGKRLARIVAFERNEKAIREGASVNRWLWHQGQRLLEIHSQSVEEEDWHGLSNDVVLLGSPYEGSRNQFTDMIERAWLSLRPGGLLVTRGFWASTIANRFLDKVFGARPMRRFPGRQDLHESVPPQLLQHRVIHREDAFNVFQRPTL